MAKKYKVELNSNDNLQDLLQEVYLLAEEQIIQTQNEINKVSSAVNWAELTPDEIAKLSKSIHDFMNIKDRAIAKKLEVSKLLSEVIAHNGNVNGAIEGDKGFAFSLSDMKKAVADAYEKSEKESSQVQSITLKKK